MTLYVFGTPVREQSIAEDRGVGKKGPGVRGQGSGGYSPFFISDPMRLRRALIDEDEPPAILHSSFSILNFT
jgi:hypothetical protein